MRFVLIALLLIGCGPGPKSARGDDSAAITRYESLAKEFSETVGNTNNELSAIEQRLGNVEAKLGKIEKLLSVDSESSNYVPQVVVPEPPAEAAPVKADAPPAAASSDQRITFQGKPIDVAAWLKRSVTFVDIRGDVDAHLRDHGLEGDFSRFSRSQKLQLHSVAHSYGVPLKSTPARKIVVKAPAVVLPYSSNCPNGNCARQGMYGYSTRSRLFGWRR
jgi:hypothetical protein